MARCTAGGSDRPFAVGACPVAGASPSWSHARTVSIRKKGLPSVSRYRSAARAGSNAWPATLAAREAVSSLSSGPNSISVNCCLWRRSTSTDASLPFSCLSSLRSVPTTSTLARAARPSRQAGAASGGRAATPGFPGRTTGCRPAAGAVAGERERLGPAPQTAAAAASSLSAVRASAISGLCTMSSGSSRASSLSHVPSREGSVF